MNSVHINGMVSKLRPVLKDTLKARTMLQRYWRSRVALVWIVKDVHLAANEREIVLTNAEAMTVLESLFKHYDRQEGVKWADLTTLIQEQALGRKMTAHEIDKFVKQDIVTVQK